MIWNGFSFSRNVVQKRAFIAHRGNHHCASLQLGAGKYRALRTVDVSLYKK
ncbi:unnamed protein product [Photorhabdus laumondii subsp. laumondii TTO1]|uniref:Photorhabdus luminescens subsp. laumondii TTO1 complete genome segment 8/17 n=1 Tax=Photorhabdus laumondii subsp. laumondii (strain DSM 15139 / CIP 105565 / TT01) TaxID=243265 RepID=Q7N4H0_PHOLL|nr:unnamed protein product [Photorhabdus laumondii subsp. laumondii TTO1]